MAWVVWVPLFALIVWRAPWRRLSDPALFNVWMGMVVLLTVIWSMKAGVKPGLGLHLLGATVFTLSFGPALAFVGLSLITLGVTLNGAAGFFALAMNALLLAGVGVGFSDGFHRLLLGVLPKNFFVYIFINGFLGAALTVLSVGAAACLLLGGAEVYAWEYLMTEYFPYFLLLGFAEAWLSGMVLTLFVVYRPDWVLTFDDTHYLADK